MIHTGFYPNWRALTKEQKDQVAAERKKKKTGRKPTGGQNAIKTELESLKKKLGKNKRTVAALKNKVSTLNVGNGEGADEEENVDDAGDSFGGKQNKKSKLKDGN